MEDANGKDRGDVGSEGADSCVVDVIRICQQIGMCNGEV